MAMLVTGGAGFIGSALVRHLVQHTDQTVVTIDKLNYAGNQAALAAVKKHPQPVFYHANICNAAALQKIFSRHRITAVFHLAAESHVDRSIANPNAFIQSNIVGTFTLLEAVREYWQQLPVKEQVAFRFIHISTDEVFGDLGLNDHPPLKEQSCYIPSSPYSASKASSDHLVRAWQRTYGIPAIITHCANNYGPYQYPEKLIPFMIEQALRRRPLPIYGQGNQVRDWIHVNDHVRALQLIWEKGRIGQSYNISAQHQMTNIELVQQICQYLDEIKAETEAKEQAAAAGQKQADTAQKQVDTTPRQADTTQKQADARAKKEKQSAHHDPEAEGDSAATQSYADLITHVADRPGHDQRYALDASKLRQELGWQPQVEFDAGLKDTVRWYVEYFAAGN